MLILQKQKMICCFVFVLKYYTQKHWKHVVLFKIFFLYTNLKNYEKPSVLAFFCDLGIASKRKK